MSDQESLDQVLRLSADRDEARAGRDAEVKRLRTALAQIANWPESEMYTSLAPAVSMKTIAKDALGKPEEAIHKPTAFCDDCLREVPWTDSNSRCLECATEAIKR